MSRIIWLCFLLLQCAEGFSQAPSIQEDLALWKQLKQQPITEERFRAVCDLCQRIGKTKLDTSYAILAEYTPMVKATGNRQWTHVLLMGWAKAKESFGYYAEAEQLYWQARANASDTGRLYREVLVATLLMFAEANITDSIYKYARIGEDAARKAGDKESLSFVYTFSTAPLYWANKGDSLKWRYDQAIQLAQDLPDKNALFTAKYNYANKYCRNNPQEQAKIYAELVELANDPSLNHYPRKLYERTAFTFRNAKPSAYYQLLQVNQLLTDYASADKYAKIYYDLAIAPNPNGTQAPYFNTELSIVKAYQGKWDEAKQYLEESRRLFNKPEADIPYPSYFLGAGLLAEHNKQYRESLQYFTTALQKGNTVGLHIVPLELYYAHSLIQNGELQKATKVFEQLPVYISERRYAAPSLYYYKYYAELLKAKGDLPGYTKALTIYHDIKDSLSSLNRYRAVEEIQAKMDLKDKEQQIQLLHEEQAQREASIRKERIFYSILGILGIFTIVFLVLYVRNRQARNRQQQALQQSKLLELEKQQHIEHMESVMQAEENERIKIAGQLHDEVNAMLALATLNISSILEKQDINEPTGMRLFKTQETITTVSTTIRNLSHRLTPLMIEKYGFRAAVEDVAEMLNLSGRIKTETIIIGFEHTEKYTATFLNDLYRIIQELMQNVVKHAGATHAMLELVEHEQHISLMVEDDGIGIKADSIQHGMGLSTIQSKIRYLNGILEIKKKNDKGTLVVIEIPLPL